VADIAGSGAIFTGHSPRRLRFDAVLACFLSGERYFLG